MTTQLVRPSVPFSPSSPAGPRHRRRALVIGHRGAPGYRPEHTLASYELAIRMGADAVEPDLVATRDGVLVARHEPQLSGTTDVATRPEFADRCTTKVIDGEQVTGWFTEDLTLAELRTLRATERFAALRPANQLYDGRWSVVTLEEIIALVRGEARRAGRPVGLVLELKHSRHFASVGLALEPLLLDTLARAGLAPDDPTTPVWVESFETAPLRWLARHSRLRLVQLVESSGVPADGPPSYADMLTPRGLDAIASYAEGVAVRKDLVLPADGVGPTSVVDDAHEQGLTCWVYTLRPENAFLAPRHRRGSEPAGYGDLTGEVEALVEAGVDGLFVDTPDLAVGVVARTAVA